MINNIQIFFYLPIQILLIMSTQTLQKSLSDILAPAGIQFNGPNPWDLQINNDGFYKRVLSQGTLGLGESYMDGWWNGEQLDVFCYKVLRADLYKKARFGFQYVNGNIICKNI